MAPFLRPCMACLAQPAIAGRLKRCTLSASLLVPQQVWREDPSCSALLTLVSAAAAPGLICTDCQPHQVVNDAIEDARSICLREYGDAPDVRFRLLSHLGAACCTVLCCADLCRCVPCCRSACMVTRALRSPMCPLTCTTWCAL